MQGFLHQFGGASGATPPSQAHISRTSHLDRSSPLFSKVTLFSPHQLKSASKTELSVEFPCIMKIEADLCCQSQKPHHQVIRLTHLRESCRPSNGIISKKVKVFTNVKHA